MKLIRFCCASIFFVIYLSGYCSLSGSATKTLFKHDTSITNIDTNKNKTKFIFVIDKRNSIALGTKAKMTGFKIGLEVNRVHRFGLGFYNNSEPIILPDPKFEARNQEAQVEFGYTALYYEHIVFQDHKWELTAPVFFGGGQAKIQIVNLDGSEVFDETGNTIVEPQIIKMTFTGFSGTAQYKLRPWLGLGVGLGYRFMLSKNENARKAFSSPIYVFKIKVFVGEIIRARKERRIPKKEAKAKAREIRRAQN